MQYRYPNMGFSGPDYDLLTDARRGIDEPGEIIGLMERCVKLRDEHQIDLDDVITELHLRLKAVLLSNDPDEQNATKKALANHHGLHH